MTIKTIDGITNKGLTATEHVISNLKDAERLLEALNTIDRSVRPSVTAAAIKVRDAAVRFIERQTIR